MNAYLIIIILALVGEFLVRSVVRYLNLKSMSPNLPSEFDGFYQSQEYQKSQRYTQAKTKLSYVTSSVSLLAIIGLIFIEGFGLLDNYVRGFGLSTVPTGLLFFGLLFLANDWLSFPFSLYNTFVIEGKFGFNKTTIKTFLLDKLKSYLLTLIFGTLILSAILFFFIQLREWAWLYAWGLTVIFSVLAPPIYTSLISPLFNQFTPLEEGELKTSIQKYADQVKFPLAEIFIMDGSRRSSHANAYFTGFGNQKRIVLFDTLIENHSVNELVAVIAHEVGHYKEKHLLKNMILSVAHSGFLFYLLSHFIDNPALFSAFGMQQTPLYAGLVFFGLLYSPIEFVLSIALHGLSRRHEYQADAYAVKTLGMAENLILALKNLSVSNLGNLTPHPINVFLNYSHPPVLQRISAMRELKI